MAEAGPALRRQLRILYVTHGYGYGVGAVLRTLITGMVGRGHKVAVISRGTPFAEWPEAPEGLVVYDYGKLASFIPTMRRAIRDRRPDVIHGHMLREATLAAAFARLRSLPYLYTEHGRPGVRSALGRLSVGLVARLCTAVTFPSAAALDDWSVASAALGSKGLVIPNAVAIPTATEATSDLRKSLGISEQAVMLLCVGSVNDNKNQKMLAASISQLREDLRGRIFLVFAGGVQEETERSATLLIAHQAGFQDRVLFLGHRDDASKLIAASDVVVMTSRSESFGIALLEAMAAGKPVISTACGGPNGIVLHEETGLLVPVDDVGAMAVALRALVDDPEMAAAMGRAGLRRARETYSVEAFCDSYEDLYRDMIGECGSRGGGGSA